MGKVTFLRTIFNQRGEIVQQGEFKQLIRKYPKSWIVSAADAVSM